MTFSEPDQRFKPGATLEALLQRRNRLLGPAYRLFYDRPVHIVEGRGAWLTGADGNRYLDAYNNVPHVGHCHPRVVEAICTQATTLNTHTRYLHEQVLDYAERLLDRFPAALDVAMFACTGSEANELALRMARAATGAFGIIAVEHAYHGNSQATAELSGVRAAGADGPAHVALVPCPDAFRGAHRGPDAGARYAETVGRAIDELKARGHAPAAFIIDTVLASNGLPRIPGDWLAGIMKHVRDAGALFIADEVQPGFGRMGSHFWGWQMLGVEPDIVTLGKPMGNGHPISGVVTRAELAGAFQKTSNYFNTFGGNPVSCAAAMAVLDVLDEEQLPQRALATGKHLRAGLRALAETHTIMGDVRGSGGFTAVDLVTDRETREPAAAAAARIVNAMRERGVLLGSSGPFGNVLKIRSPLVFDLPEADFLLERLADVLGEVSPEG
ncbi:MAG: aminotransferase class III-fold pyridoxal phosphate-dependent enzyme [Xanthomonadales bacterium]|jgi:4-aminobutyrate aminotransferase-like enzyme|nr:aminotransferase class III-fold pyridoxal phosphate-dependent enzyme [Xanthomonadales bacterium]